MNVFVLMWMLPLVPGVLGLVGLLAPLARRRLAATLAVIGTAVPAVGAAALMLIPSTVAAPALRDMAPPVLAEFGDVEVSLAVSVSVDTATVWVLAAVAAVALAVQIYSIDYMKHSDRYVPYAAQISLFTAAMLLVVVSDDLIVLLVGWEVMGACSYLLIGHYRSLAEAPRAAMKAFLVTRVGDVGFIIGVLLLGVHAGTFRISYITENVKEIDPGVLAAACLLILAGAVGKSAQFPLHSWLPDAMAGPTPISALIHAATMVAAGAVVLAKLFSLYVAVPGALTVIAVVAAVTMIGAACAALASDDLKRVLAWSTCSQVALMFGAIAVEGESFSMLHLFSHAFFKAALFLAAGVVIHRVASSSMSRMGGLRRGGPATFWTMTIGLAALAGLPLTSGFWSKEFILTMAHADLPQAPIVLWAGIVTAGLTAAYATRAWLRVFFGRSRAEAPIHGGDPGLLMTGPMLALTAVTVLLSLWMTASLGRTVFTYTGKNLPYITDILPVLLATGLGVAVAWLLWRRDTASDPARVLGPARPVFAAGFGFDTLQDLVVVRPIRALARVVRRGDEQLIDGAVEGSGKVAVRAGSAVDAAHTFGVPRHLLTALAGALLIGVLAVLTAMGVLS